MKRLRLLVPCLAVTACLGCAAPAFAQDVNMPSSYLPQNGGAGIRTGNITSTGATVPRPGVSLGNGETPLDQRIQREDNKIDYGICKGC